MKLLAVMGIVVVSFRSSSGDCSPFASTSKGCYLEDSSFFGGGKWITVSCSTGYVLTSSGECVIPCPPGQYLFGSSCASCAGNCDSCFGPHPFQCSSCSSKHSLNFQRICSRLCDRTDQFGSPNEDLSCSDCDVSCGTCFTSGQTGCSSCPESTTGETFTLRPFPYALGRTDAGYCLKDPLAKNFFRQYPGDRLVTQCPTGCTACIDRYTCSQCAVGYVLYPPPDSGAEYSLCQSTTA